MELLIAVAVILLLISVMMPSLTRAKELTRRVICGSNLHHLGMAVTHYAADNGGQLMCTLTQFGGEALPPCIKRKHDPNLDQSNHLWIWNIESINRYVQSFSKVDPDHESIFLCPSADPEYWSRSYYDALNDTSGEDVPFPTPYAYYARTESWQPIALQNGAERDLTGKTPASERLLMSDYVWRSWMTSRLRYNHGKDGPALPGKGVRPVSQDGEAAPLAGINRLLGDGAVRWKQGSRMHVESMNFEDYPDGFIATGEGSDMFFY